MKDNSKTENAIEVTDTRGDKIGPIDPWSKLNTLPTDSADGARRARLIELSLGIRGMIGIADEHSEGRMLSTLDRLANIGPQDAAESMLAELMVITHSAAVACASAAYDAGLGSPVASTHLVHVERLTAAYVAQMTMLDRRRGKASQQVIVKRVEVTKGGQAVVGHIDARNNNSKT